MTPRNGNNGGWRRNRTLLVIILVLVLGNILLSVLVTSWLGARTYMLQAQMGRYGPLEPPVAVAVAVTTPHAFSRGGSHLTGLRLAVAKKQPRYRLGGFVPAAVDLSSDAPPVANQDSTDSCTAWALAYYLRGWYALRDGNYPPSGFAPMYVFSQAPGGSANQPTSMEDTADILHRQGVATRASYWQGDDNYARRPTVDERAEAMAYTIGGYSMLFEGQHWGMGIRDAIEQSIAAGNPVVIGITVQSSFSGTGPRNYYITGQSGSYQGGHALFAPKYDANGLWVENEWGTGWGLAGWAELSWSFVESQAMEAIAFVQASTHRTVPHHGPPVVSRTVGLAPNWLVRAPMLLRPRPAPWPRGSYLVQNGQLARNWGRQPRDHRWVHVTVRGHTGYLLRANMAVLRR